MTGTHAADETGHHAPAPALERLTFFSDAVFAISITLLVIEIRAPDIPRGSPDAAYWDALAQPTPHFIGFIISFFVIAQFWSGHHRAFDHARHWSPRLFLPNICLLFTIAAMPFFTAFISNNAGMRVPTVLYTGWLAVTGLCNLWVNSIAVSAPVAGTEEAAAYSPMIRARGQAVVLMALTAMAIGVIFPWGAQPALATFPYG